MGQEISQQQQQHHNQNHNHNHNHNLNLNQNLKRAQPHRKNYKDPIYTPASNISTSSSSNSTDDYDANYRLRHKYNLTKQTYERSKILASNSTNRTSTQSECDSHYAKINSNNNINNGNNINSGKFLQRSSSSSQSSDSGIYNSSCHCSSLSSLSSSAVSSCSASSSSGCPSSLLSSKSSRSLDKQKQYLSHHLYIKSYLDILEEDERARAHFKSARPGGIRNYTPKILAGGSDTSATKSTLSTSAPAASFGLYRNPKQRGVASSSATAAATAVVSGRNYQEDPWI